MMTDEELGKTLRLLVKSLLMTTTEQESKKEVRYKLTLPHDKNGNFSGDALEIPHSKLAAFKSPHYDGITYHVPAKGAVTDNANYPRTERRYYLVDPSKVVQDAEGFDEMIDFTRGVDSWILSQEITILSMALKGKVVVSQSHAVKAPPDYKVVVYGNGEVKVLCKTTDTTTTDDVVIDLTENKTKLIKVGEKFKLDLKFNGYKLEISLNGGKVFTASFETKKSKFYPKEGAYNAAEFPVTLKIVNLL